MSQTLSELSCDIQVADLGHIVNGKEYICRFDVAMYDSHLVQTLQTFKYSSAPLPDLSFCKGLSAVESGFDFFSEIPAMCKFHNQSQFSFIFIKDGLPVLHDVWVVHRGEYPHLIESILFILLLEIGYLDLHRGISTLLRAYSRLSLLLLTL